MKQPLPSRNIDLEAKTGNHSLSINSTNIYCVPSTGEIAGKKSDRVSFGVYRLVVENTDIKLIIVQVINYHCSYYKGEVECQQSHLPGAVLENQQDTRREQAGKKMTAGKDSRVSSGTQWVSAGLRSEGSQCEEHPGQVEPTD